MLARTEIVPKPIVFDAYLWHAARDMLASMPTAAADPTAGRLMTQWSEPGGGTGQIRLRVTIGLNYESDYGHAVLATVDRERFAPDGTWREDGSDAAAATALAAAIATHAGELRLAANSHS